MKGLLFATAFLALVAPQQKGVQVNVNAKDGEVITGQRRFRVTVVASNPVTQVEFYVGSDLRDKDTSTPYEFVIDSLSEQDGDLKVRFKAYTTEGESGEASYTFKIDNGVSKGAAFHVERGEALASEAKWEDAIMAGRIALRADEKSIPARLLLARAYLGKGDTAQAQKFAEDVLDVEPNNRTALDLLSSIKIKAAFRTVTTEGASSKDSLEAIREGLIGAVNDRRKALDNAVDAAGTPSAANMTAWADTALRAGRYSLVASTLKGELDRDPRQTAIGNRLVYALLRMGRTNDAFNTLNQMQRQDGLDSFGYAALAVVKADQGDATGSDEAISEAIISDPDDPSVLAAQAYIALKYIRSRTGGQTALNLHYDDLSASELAARNEARATLQRLVTQLEQQHGARTETLYFKEALYNKLADYPKARLAFEAAVLAEPANYDAFIEAGNRSLSSTQTSNLPEDLKTLALSYARIMFDAALAGRPDSVQALTGLALVSTIEGKTDEAVKWSDAAVKANPEYAAAHVAASTVYSLASSSTRKQADNVRAKIRQGGLTGAEQQSLEQQARQLEDLSNQYGQMARENGIKAGAIDKRVQGQDLTRPYTAWRYYTAGGRTPVLPLPR